jgi:FkbM family methyltransferase
MFGVRAARYIRAVSKILAIRSGCRVRAVPHVFGIHLTHHTGRVGVDFACDVQLLLRDVARPVVFDVGGNIGQSVIKFRGLLPGSTIHSFEPSPTVFRQLEENTNGLRRVFAVNAAVGASDGTSVLLENAESGMSSLLELGADGWGKVLRETPVDVITLDGYCAAHDIDRVALLKIDTQGADLEVLRGSEGLLADHRVRAVFIEVLFSALYEHSPPLTRCIASWSTGTFGSYRSMTARSTMASWAGRICCL